MGDRRVKLQPIGHPQKRSAADVLERTLFADHPADVVVLTEVNGGWVCHAAPPLVGLVRHHDGGDDTVGRDVLGGELLEPLTRGAEVQLVPLSVVVERTVLAAVQVDEFLVFEEQLLDGDAHYLGLVPIAHDLPTNGLVLVTGDFADDKNGLVHGELPFLPCS